MLAELRETTIRRLGELLDAAPDVADQIAALERAGVAPEKLFAAALKRRGAAPAARPPALDGSWAAALRTGRVAASLHSLVVDNGAVYGFGFDPLGAPRRGARHAPRALPGLAGRAVSAAAGWGFSLALTDDGAVHGGGRGFSPGSLAAVAGLGAVRVAMVAAGAAHALCLDDAGRVWSLGCGDDGRLGRGPDRDPAPAVVCVRIKSSTRLQCAHNRTVLTRAHRLCFENSMRAIDPSKNQENRLRCDRARESQSLVGTSQTGG